MKEILEYQRVDSELHKLKRSINHSEERDIMFKMAAYVKDAQNKSVTLEKNADDLIKEYTELRKSYDVAFKKIETITHKDSSKMTEEDLSATFGEINSLSSELFMIERKLNIIINGAREKLRMFDQNKKNAIKAREKHKESKSKHDELVASSQPKIAELEGELAKLEKQVPSDILAKYKSLKNDNIFPVFVPLNGTCCGGCRMEIPMSKLNQLDSTQYIVCEHCGRFIYKK